MRLDVFTQVPHAFAWLTEQRPLATVVIGGLATATFLTLYVLPTLYVWFERDKRQAQRPVDEIPQEVTP